jgi:hypothetical protein
MDSGAQGFQIFWGGYASAVAQYTKCALPGRLCQISSWRMNARSAWIGKLQGGIGNQADGTQAQALRASRPRAAS